MELKVEKIVGTPNSSWTQVHYFSGLERDKLAQRGRMVLLLSLNGVPQGTAAPLGREIISRIYEEYYGNLKGKPMERLRLALTKIGREKPVYLEKKVDFSILIFVSWQEVVYLALWQQGKIFLSRKGEVVEILAGREGEVKVVSGKLLPGDLFLLGTEPFFTQLPRETIVTGLKTGSGEKAAGVFLPLVHAQSEQGGMGAALIKVEKEEEKKEGKKKITFPSLRFSPPRPRRRLSPAFAGLFLILLLASVFLGWRKRSARERERRFRLLYSQAEEKLKAAEAIKGLSWEKSLALGKESLQLVDQALKISPQNSQALNLRQKGKSLVVSLGGGERKKPELFFNLRLLSEVVTGKKIFLSPQKIYVLDGENGKIFSLTWPGKRAEIAAAGSFIKGKDSLLAVKNQIYLLSSTGVEEGGEKEGKKIIEFKEGEEMVEFAYWGGNFYLLDKKGKELWKYPALAPPLEERRAWFKDEPRFSWEEVVDFDIDGRIWFLTKKGKIFKYFSGREDSFPQKQLPQGEAAFLSVAREGERLVFWEKEKAALWVWSKKGELLAKIPLDLKTVDDLALTPAGDKVFLLQGSNLYQLDLRPYLSASISKKGEGE